MKFKLCKKCQKQFGVEKGNYGYCDECRKHKCKQCGKYFEVSLKNQVNIIDKVRRLYGW